MVLKDGKFVFANKLGEMIIYDQRNTKNALRKFHDHMGAIKDLTFDQNSKLFTASFDRYVNMYCFDSLKLEKKFFVS